MKQEKNVPRKCMNLQTAIFARKCAEPCVWRGAHMWSTAHENNTRKAKHWPKTEAPTILLFKQWKQKMNPMNLLLMCGVNVCSLYFCYVLFEIVFRVLRLRIGFARYIGSFALNKFTFIDRSSGCPITRDLIIPFLLLNWFLA